MDYEAIAEGLRDYCGELDCNRPLTVQRGAEAIEELLEMYGKAKRLLHKQGYSDWEWLGRDDDSECGLISDDDWS